MKLYLAAGHYVGTQVDAKRLDKDFEQVDVPVSKEELITYLNDPLKSSAILRNTRVRLTFAPAKPFSGSLTDVEEFIQNADHVALGRVTENAILRMGELMREVPKAAAVPQIFDEPEPEPVAEGEVDPFA